MSLKGRTLTEEQKAKIRAGVLAAQAVGADMGRKGVSKPGSGARPGHIISDETRRKIAATLKGQEHTPERCLNISLGITAEGRASLARNTFDGGELARSYADILCPVGFVREHTVPLSDRICRMDFAHIESKVNIELDGPTHTVLTRRGDRQRVLDNERDVLLRLQGWKVIRVRT